MSTDVPREAPLQAGSVAKHERLPRKILCMFEHYDGCEGCVHGRMTYKNLYKSDFEFYCRCENDGLMDGWTLSI